jgi:hypothetical protein
VTSWTARAGALLRRFLRPSSTHPAPVGPGTRPGAAPGLTLEYAPHLDGRPDPGEIVWTWVPFEEDASRGKDRPVLLVGRDGDRLAGLMLSSKDHDRAAAQDGRRWLDIGSGAWDPRGRPSEVRLDRIIAVEPARVRREGAVVPRPLFERVVAAMLAARGGRADW